MKKTCIALFTLGTTYLSAFFPLTHIYLAELLCETQGIEQRELVVKGSIFPDIYKLTDLPKTTTHQSTEEDLYEVSDPFKQGLLLHVLADQKRKELVRDSRIEEALSSIPVAQRSKLLQLVEDELVYNWFLSEGCPEAFTYVSEAETSSGLSQEILSQWNTFLTTYVSQRPSLFLKRAAAENQSYWGVPPEQLAEWSVVVPQLAHDPMVQCYFISVLQYFTECFLFGDKLESPVPKP